MVKSGKSISGTVGGRCQCPGGVQCGCSGQEMRAGRWAGPRHRGRVGNKESGFYSNFSGKVLELSSGAATVYFHI